jgi:hypothetical protein
MNYGTRLAPLGKWLRNRRWIDPSASASCLDPLSGIVVGDGSFHRSSGTPERRATVKTMRIAQKFRRVSSRRAETE